ncbi:MAG: GNAT family N-acetyltransferase [Fimbriimonadaceae bacterium]|nr:GNAT family N-acetyltransferase [Fimbriimonadaceae bacterium]
MSLIGSRVRLVPPEPDRHLEQVTRWINDPAVTDTLAVGAFPMSRAAEIDWLNAMNQGRPPTEIVFAIELIDTGEHIGMSGIHGIDWISRSANTGSYIGPVEWRGQGLGTEAVNLRSAYCFLTLNLETLFSAHLGENPGSARMQAKAGYEVWGCKPRRFYKNGAWVDSIETMLTRERWAELHAAGKLGT